MKFINASKKMTGLALPLLAVRTGNGPCGEFPDIASLARLAKYWSMDVVQLLPVNDTGSQTSPYSALSAFALNPIYLRIQSLPELEARKALGLSPGRGGEAAAKAREAALKLTSAFGESAKVPYEEILERKAAILETLWNAISTETGGDRLIAEVEAWSARNAWVKTYACFVELKRRFGGKAWWEWPEFGMADQAFIEALWRDPAYASGLRFRAWLQMRAEEQFAAACAEARSIGVDVLGDIPILMNADSADVWFDRALFDTNRAAGAPPDMYSQLGQNWGFPLYHWDEIERRGYSFWKARLASADKFYTMYRIDHVLGFFRIWAIDKHEADGFLGHFVPEFSLAYPELDALGFDKSRIRWLSKPHVPGQVVDEALSGFAGESGDYLREKLFTRIGNEDLFLFTPGVKGGADIAETIRAAAAIAKTADGSAKAEIPESAILSSVQTLQYWWRNRTLLETAPGQFMPTWEYRGTTAWQSLSEHEKSMLEALVSRRKGESLLLWERTGRKILKVLAQSVDMQACAEDLGAVPPCVPAVLGELGIPGLRVLRWTRAWDKEGAPYVPLGEYPEESIACTSVHDSTNLRQWWEEEADKDALWAMVRNALSPGVDKGASPKRGIAQKPEPRLAETPPSVLDPDAAFTVMAAFAAARSRCVVYPLQDLLAASARHREANPADERINVPGTMSGANWLYRMKPQLEELLGDDEFARRIASLAGARG